MEITTVIKTIIVAILGISVFALHSMFVYMTTPHRDKKEKSKPKEIIVIFLIIVALLLVILLLTSGRIFI